MDLAVITNNFTFLIVQGLIGIGPFIGGTLRLAIPAIILGFVLGIFIGLARLAGAVRRFVAAIGEAGSDPVRRGGPVRA